jgi:hypothetical protein
VHQEFDTDGLSRIRRHVHRRIEPGLSLVTLVEDDLQDVAICIRDVGVLPVELDDINSVIPVPEAQCASASRHRELLVERAVAERLRGGVDIARPC